MHGNYRQTVRACFVGYIVQAIVNNFLPLLFLTLQRQYSISFTQITLLITFNFGIQLTVDLLSARVSETIGIRTCMVAAHVFAAAGFLLLPVLPEILPPFAGILIAVMLYGIGGGLLEVLVSPIVESCPSDHKPKAMSLLHSFYCWGQVGVILFSTLFFAIFGTQHWNILACLWAVIPLINAVMFLRVPFAPLIEEDESRIPVRAMLKQNTFWLLILMMACAGACELTVSQWASFFAEEGLHISKTAGDLAGPMLFGIFMGSARTFYGKYGDKINIDRFMTASTVLCICSYLLISLVPFAPVNLAGCALCGLSVGIMWPGAFSKAAASFRRGGTALFSLLALAGDLGCAGGPTFAGFISNFSDLKTGILAATVFPVLMLVGLLCLHRTCANTDTQPERNSL